MKLLSQFPNLADAPLLRDLSLDQQQIFLSKCSTKVFQRPTIILSQGEKPDAVHLIAEGNVEISYLSAEGHKTIIAHDGPNRTLGAIEAVANRPCAATCTAYAEAIVLQCSINDFVQELQNTTFLRNFADLSYTMLQHDNATKAIDQFFTAEQRICRYLGRLAGENRMFQQSQSYLANAVGCTRQTVNKELSLLKDIGVINISKGKVEILDRSGLEQRIDELEVRRSGSSS
ncbi:MAG: Crp/Fnr family transcriptional regulator [Pseudomonadota bacterium]